MNSTILLIENVPVDCDEQYLSFWIEARGFRTMQIRLVRDIVSGTSPSFAHVKLMVDSKLSEAVRTLDGQRLGGRRIRVTPLRIAGACAA
jgi:hypothetical protein